MAATVTLELDGKTFEVLRCFNDVRQAYDESGNPASGVIAGKIGLIMQGTTEDTFNKWMGDPQKSMDGKVTFSINDSAFKKLEFKNAFLVRFHEGFHAEGQPGIGLVDNLTIFVGNIQEENNYRDLENYHRRLGFSFLMSCTIAAERISIDGVDHDNNW